MKSHRESTRQPIVSVKQGTEVKEINKWKELSDELHELKKIFFTFLKKWTMDDRNKADRNALTTDEVHIDDEKFELDEVQLGKVNDTRKMSAVSTFRAD